MVDKAGGILDPTAQAVRMERLEGQQNLLAQQVKASLDAMTSALNNVQLETRAVTNKLGDVVGLQHSQDTNKSSIEDMKKSLGDLNTRLEEWFDDFDERNNRRWEQYERNRDDWRLRHEAENENDKKELEKEIRTVRETVIRALGWGAAAGALGGVIIGGFLWSLNDRFGTYGSSLTQQRETSQYNRGLIDDQREKMHEIELYLARGGVNAREPYVTKQQREGNGQPK